MTAVLGAARPRKPHRRTLAVLVAAALLSVGPGLAPLPAPDPSDTAARAAPAAPAAAAAPAAVPAYRQTRACVADAPAPTTVTRGVSWAQQQLRYSELWGLATGKGIKVAVIDSGVSPGPAFGERLVGVADYIVAGEKGLRDCDGHGTLVAGIIAGASDPDTGFAGVAPDATILSIRQASEAYAPTQPGGRNNAGTPQTLATAIDLAVAQGAKVINISEAECGNAGTVDDPRLTASVTAAIDKDVVVVAAAGNLGSGPACREQNTPGKPAVTGATPADIPGVIAVGATDEKGQPADFSLGGPWIGLAAPGVGIISTNPYPGRGGQVDSLTGPNGTQKIQGTSFAAPYVAGVAALVRERFPKLNARQVTERLLATAAGGHGPSGRNGRTGYGMLDPRAALTAVRAEESSDVPAKYAPATAMAPRPGTSAEPEGKAPSLWAALVITAGLLTAAVTAAVRRRH